MPDERKYKSLPTTIGLTLIAAAVEGGGKVNITHAAVGDGGGTYYVPTPDMTALRGEKWRGSIAGKWVNETSPNMTDVKVIIPADVGGFTVREAALFDGDGNMVVVCNIPDVEKAIIENGATGTLTIIVHVLVTNSEVLEFKIDPMLDVMTQADFDREIGKHNKDPEAHSEQIATAVSDKIKELTEEGGLATDEKVVEIVTEELAKHPSGGYLGILHLTLRADAWEEAAEPSSGYGFVCDVDAEGVKSDHVPVGSSSAAYSDIADKAGVRYACETFDGYIRFLAKRRPEGDIVAEVALIGPGGGTPAPGPGGVTPGAGLEYDAEGNLQVKAGAGLSFDTDKALAVDQQTVMTDEDIVNEDEVKQSVEEIFGVDGTPDPQS